MLSPPVTDWQSLLGEIVVVDVNSPFVCLGRLVEVDAGFLHLVEVDLHDLRDTQSTREKYVLDSRLHGVRVNRRALWLSLREVVAISRFSDVVVD
jgi:hypothetical protein